MRRVKCYGGPLHGRTVEVCDGAHRIETIAACRPAPVNYYRDVPDEVLISMPACRRVTYYIERWTMTGMTKAKAYVYADIEIAQYEGAELTQREKFDLDHELRNAPIKWKREPSFLYEFDRWWEWKLHLAGVKKVWIYW